MKKTLQLLFCVVLIVAASTNPAALHAQIITTVAGNGGTTLGDGGPATAAMLSNPTTVAVDASGDMYIADWGDQRIRYVNGSTGIITTIAGNGTLGTGADGIAATASALYRPNGVAFDSHGNFYIAEQGGCVVRKVNSSGIITTLAGTGSDCSFSGDGGAATASLLDAPTNLAIDPSGNIYIADWGNNRVRMINTSGTISTIAGGGSGTTSGIAATAANLYNPYSVSLDGYGNLYISDEHNYRLVVVNLSTGILTNVSGDFGVAGFGGDGSAATSSLARFNQPDGIVADAGSLYIADYSNSRIRQINIGTDLLTTAVGDGSTGFAGDGFAATACELNGPAGVALDVYGNIYIADFENNRIRKVASGNHPPSFVNGETQTLSVCENSVADSLNTLLEVDDIDVGQTETWAMRFGPYHGTAYVAYTTTSTGSMMRPTGLYYTPTAGYSGPDSFRVLVNDGISVDSTLIRVTVTPFFAGIITPQQDDICPGNTISLTDDTTGGTWSGGNTHASVGSGGLVTGISAGVDTVTYTISNTCGTSSTGMEVSVGNPIINTIAGGGSSLGDEGPATAGEFNYPTTIFVDPSGNKLVTDYLASRVRAIVGGFIFTIAGNGTASSTGDGGAATAATVNEPAGVCEDAAGNIYIAEQGGCRVREINYSTGNISTIVGNGTCATGGDGLAATAATVNAPTGVEVDAAGNIYIAEWGGGRVRMINTSGIISTIAGGGAATGDGVPATTASLTTPYAVWLDGLGSLFISEENVYKVRQVNLSTNIITTFAGTGVTGSSGDNGQATNATFAPLGDIYADKYNVYIADGNNNRLRMVDRATGIVTTIAGTGTAGFSGDGGAATAAKLNKVSGVTLDKSGNIYIVEVTNQRVREITLADPSVSAITGATSVCAGATDNLADATTGGTWSSSATAIASVGSSSGAVLGVAPGTAIITYSVLFPCGTLYATQTITVTPPPSAITGNPTICLGSSSQLNDVTSGGTWSSSSTAVATIGSSSALAAGISLGTSMITYSISAGCNAYLTVTVAAAPAAITPSAPVSICTGNFFDFSDGTGTWTSSSGSIASVGSASGVVTGVSSGTATITFTNAAGCYATKSVTIVQTPAAISPATATVCQYATTTLTESISGGTWSSSASGIASVTGGSVSGVSAGSATITYAISSCISTATVTVNSSPTSITGPFSICDGSSTTLSSSPPTGTWSSSNTTVATVGSGSGLVSGISVGTTAITYILSSGCYSTATETITTAPGVITGTTTVCTGFATNLSDAPTGGTWTSSNGAVGTISSSGTVTGVGAGTESITYSLGTGCIATTFVTVNPTPAAISGANNVCVGSSTLLTDGTSGGVWSSSNTAVGTVTGGTVTGVTAGGTNISYTIPSTGCYSDLPFTVNAAPTALSGVKSVCTGFTTSLGSSPTGGTWSSSSATATVNSSGLVSGLTAGTATITYSLGTGCTASAVVTVNTTPFAITGTTTLCSGGTSLLGSTPTGGSWTSSNSGVASIGSGSGSVTAVTNGTATITYMLATGCMQTTVFTVNTAPSGITGSLAVCVGATTTLGNSVSGGAWSSTNTSTATIGSGNGIALGVAAGTTSITYNLGAGCIAAATLTVNGNPATITPSTAVSICPGATTVLADVTPLGSFTSSNAAVATVGGSSGIVTGVSAGTVSISYTLSTGCYALKTATVSLGPNAISPTSPFVCVGGVTDLTDGVTGGTWGSANLGLATVGSSSGIVSGVAAGSVVITYAISSCIATTTVTVSGLLNAGTISGSPAMCVSTPITLVDAAGGGTWGSGNTSVATVGSGSGIVTGVGGGTVVITYSVTNSCGTAVATKTVTVSVPGAGAIVGSASVCSGTFATYTDAVTGGTWSLSNTSASITGGGLVTGITPGTDVITYTVTNTCGTFTTTKLIFIGSYLTAGSITGANSLCTGASTTLNDLAPGGSWSASNTALISIGTGSGFITGVAAGVDTISYTVTSGCGAAYAIYPVTVLPLPVPGSITGPTSICLGATQTYTDVATGGAWSVANATATISGTGLVTPVTTGSNIISYMVTNTCGSAVATETINIGALLTAGTISGTSSNVCIGSSITLTDGTAGGLWGASNPDATVSGGTVTGVSAGTTTISYTVTAACGSVSATYPVTVIALPVAGSITGPANLCTGSPITYTDAAGGGVWGVANATASITGGGLVTPVSAGTNIISYTVTNSCGMAVATQNVTIGTGPSAGTISGPTLICGTPITLVDGASGGTWSASNTDATVSSGGVVAGVTSGTDIISYSVSNSCGTAVATYTVAINTASGAGTILGPAGLCIGSSTTYADATTGGVWSISNASASITSGGAVTPLSDGVDTISYTVTGSCGSAVATKTITVSTYASAGTISGPGSICIGSPVTFTDGTSGGTWNSSNAIIASAGSATGIVTGLSTGSAIISYTVTNGCGTAVATATVSSGVAPYAGTIVGASTLCAGSFTIYSDVAPGGVWSVTNTSGTIAGGGIFTAVTPFSTDTVVYTVTNACGTANATKTVSIETSLSAGTITGASGVCVGSSTALADATGTGSWGSGNTSVATVGPLTGIVTGIAPGTAIISYSVTISCGTATAVTTITVSSPASAGTITGPSAVCAGSLITLADATLGGVWGSNNGNAAVSSGGIVTGLIPGIDTISYDITNYCGTASATKTITINMPPVPGTISGLSSVCPGATITLTDAAGGGVWGSANANATVGFSTGLVTGVTSGTDIISYTVANACGSVSTETVITIDPGSGPGAVTGPDSVCVGSTINLTDLVPGGTWSASNGNGTVSSGVVTGVSAGVDTISYAVTSTCGTTVATKTVIVTTTPDAGVISGSPGVCLGSGITLTESVTGGTWIASNANAVVVGPGIIDGVTLGIDTIFYTVTNSCGTSVASKILPVNPIPSVPSITGPSTLCIASSNTLSDGVAGGVWVSTDPAVASIGVSTGIITGVSSGTTEISYTITNSYGCPASATATDTVLAGSAIPPIMGSAAICVGSSVTLSDTGTGGFWSSSDPAIATVGTSSGTVNGIMAGTVTISYSVASICGTGTATTTETINLLPVVSAIAGVMHECAGSASTLMDATSGGVWSSSNVAVASIGSLTGAVTGMSAGTSTIIYTYTNTFGCSSSVSAADTVVAIPVVAGITGVIDQCIGAATTLSDATAGGVWSSSNTTIATVGATTGIVTGVAAGRVTIDYAVTDGAGCTAVASAADTVNAIPVGSAITGTLAVCVGSSTTLSNSIPFGTWSSFNTSIATVNATTGSVSGIAAGTDKIYYSVSNSCGSARDSATVAINAAPSAGTISAAYTTLCSGTTVHLTDAVSGGVWGSANTAVATVNTAGVASGVSAGSVEITYKVTNTSGCYATASIGLTIAGSIPSASITPSGSVTLCHGSSITMDVASSGTGLTYQWLRNAAAISGASLSSYTTTTAGVYSADISNGSCSETIAGPTVNPPPTPVITFVAPNELTTGTYTSYQWYLNGVAIPGATGASIHYTTGGNYTVVVTDANGCTDSSIPYSVAGVNGVQTVVNNDGIKIYPNPASSVLNIEAPVNVTVRILSIDGKVLLTLDNATGIDISTLANGIYLVQAYDADNILIKTAKFTKIE